jgi:hypothetical protein
MDKVELRNKLMYTPTPANLDAQTLTPIVRAARKSNTVEVKSWQVTPILQGRASPAGVFRISGTTLEHGEQVAWSVVVKLMDSAATSISASNHASDDPTHQFYWKRELLLYQSGLFDQLPDGLAAPECYQIDDLPKIARIWMEDVREDIGTIWPLEHYGQVARHFGRLGALYLGQRPLPTWPWLLKDQLLHRVHGSAWPAFWQHYPTLRQESALVQRGWSDELAQAFQRIWQERELFLQALTHLPHTLLHNDAGRKNLFARRRANGEFETVAVDWGSTGIGVIGEELANIIGQPIYWFNGVRPEQAWELDQIAFAGYLQGLHEGGWQGDATLVRLGYTLAMTLRTGFCIFIMEWAGRDEKLGRWIEDVMGHSLEELADTFRVLRTYVVDCAEEARRLLASPIVKRLR